MNTDCMDVETPRSMEQYVILQRAYENNGVAATEIVQLYSSRENAYRSLYNLENKGLLKRVDAPPTSKAEKLWTVTQKATRFVKNTDTET